MRWAALSAYLTLATWPAVSLCESPSAARGQAVYIMCGSCHGPRAEGEEILKAPALTGQDPSYLLRQLRNFHAGVRGVAEDPQAQAMRQILDIINSENDWHSVIAYIDAIRPLRATRKDATHDDEKGRRLYAPCVACHGPNGQGIKALGAPALAPLPAWYIADQLQKFRRGLRGWSPHDEPGQQMRAIASLIQSDSDMVTVAAYIQDTLTGHD